jgi:hypothetical protein
MVMNAVFHDARLKLLLNIEGEVLGEERKIWYGKRPLCRYG